MKTKVLVTGSRHYQNLEVVKKHFIDIGPDIVVHGRARGADACAHFAAEDIGGIEVRPYPADWVAYGMKAGPIRNQQMIDSEHRPNEPIALCLAFPMTDSIGTWDCIVRCLAAGIDVELGDEEDPAIVKRFNALLLSKRTVKKKKAKKAQ